MTFNTRQEKNKLLVERRRLIIQLRKAKTHEMQFNIKLRIDSIEEKLHELDK